MLLLTDRDLTKGAEVTANPQIARLKARLAVDLIIAIGDIPLGLSDTGPVRVDLGAQLKA